MPLTLMDCVATTPNRPQDWG